MGPDPGYLLEAIDKSRSIVESQALRGAIRRAAAPSAARRPAPVRGAECRRSEEH